jgi:hypothetical protein
VIVRWMIKSKISMFIYTNSKLKQLTEENLFCNTFFNVWTGEKHVSDNINQLSNGEGFIIVSLGIFVWERHRVHWTNPSKKNKQDKKGNQFKVQCGVEVILNVDLDVLECSLQFYWKLHAEYSPFLLQILELVAV